MLAEVEAVPVVHPRKAVAPVHPAVQNRVLHDRAPVLVHQRVIMPNSLFFYLYTLIDFNFNLIESLQVHGRGLRQFREVNLLLHLEAHGLHLRNLAQKHHPFILIENVLK